MGWRDIKAGMRATVHETFKIPAVLLSATPVDSNTEQLAIQFRLHNHQTPLGEMPGTNFGMGERLEEDPKIVFWKADLELASWTLARNQVLSVATGEAYNIEFVHPHDIETVKCSVTRLDAEDTAGLPLPA